MKRPLRVTVGNKHSDWAELKLGVPQGAVLSPLLFLLFINDLPKEFNNANFILFADDTTFLTTGKDLIEVMLRGHKCLREIKKWCEDSKLILNEDKTTHMICSLRDISTSDTGVSFHRFLGVVIDQKLTWEQHCETISKKLSSVVFLIRQLSRVVPREVLLQVYHSCFHSILAYGILAWGHSAHAKLVFAVAD